MYFPLHEFTLFNHTHVFIRKTVYITVFAKNEVINKLNINKCNETFPRCIKSHGSHSSEAVLANNLLKK